MLGDIRLLSVGRRSLSMDEKSMSGCSLTDEVRQAAEAKLSPDGDGPRMYGARRIKSTSELEAGRPLGRQYLSPSNKAVGALAVPKSGGANDSDVLFVTILEVRRDLSSYSGGVLRLRTSFPYIRQVVLEISLSVANTFAFRARPDTSKCPRPMIMITIACLLCSLRRYWT